MFFFLTESGGKCHWEFMLFFYFYPRFMGFNNDGMLATIPASQVQIGETVHLKRWKAQVLFGLVINTKLNRQERGCYLCVLVFFAKQPLYHQ